MNKKRFPIVLLCGLIVSVLLCLRLIDTAKHIKNNVYSNSLYLVVLAVLFIVILTYTVFAFLDYIKTIFDTHAVLAIADKGINDKLSIFSVGNIDWTEITEIKIVTELNTNFLVIVVNDPLLFVEGKSIFKQRILKSFLKKFGSPVVISQKRINFDLFELKEVLLKALSK